MADPRVFYDPKAKKIVRTEPPELMKFIRTVEGTDLISIPNYLYDLGNHLRIIPVQISATN